MEDERTRSERRTKGSRGSERQDRKKNRLLSGVLCLLCLAGLVERCSASFDAPFLWNFVKFKAPHLLPVTLTIAVDGVDVKCDIEQLAGAAYISAALLETSREDRLAIEKQEPWRKVLRFVQTVANTGQSYRNLHNRSVFKIAKEEFGSLQTYEHCLQRVADTKIAGSEKWSA